MDYTKVLVIILLIACLVASVHTRKRKPKSKQARIKFTTTKKTTTTTTTTTPVNICECGGFTVAVPTPNDEPTVIQIASYNSTCNSTGEKSCSIQCKSLIENSKPHRDEICSYFTELLNKMLAVFVRVCEMDWHYIGLDIKNDLCCEEGTSVQCSDDPSTDDRNNIPFL